MAEDVSMVLSLDASGAFEQVAALRDAVNKADAEWERTRRTITSQVETALTRVNRLLHLMRNIMRLGGMSIDPVADAVLNTFSAIISYMIALKAAYAVSGPWGWVMLGVTAFAFGLALMEQANAWKELVDAKKGWHSARMMMERIDPMSFSFRTG